MYDRCECGHDGGEHDRGTLCWRCECNEFADQNELVPQPKEG